MEKEHLTKLCLLRRLLKKFMQEKGNSLGAFNAKKEIFFKSCIKFQVYFFYQNQLFWLHFHRVSHKKGIDKKLLVGPAYGFNSQFSDLFGFSISVSFIWRTIIDLDAPR